MKTNVFSVLAAGLILAMLILAGPANAATLSLRTVNDVVNQGSTAVFQAEISDTSLTDTDVLTFTLSGPQNIECKFKSDGSVISGCEDITIHPTKKENKNNYGYKYGYGYGYGEETFTYGYLIQLKTKEFALGKYTPRLFLNSQEVLGGDFTIKRQSSSSGGSGCWTQWECTDWSPCVDGKQSRSCEKKINYCSAGKQPELERTCLWSESLNYNTKDKINLNDTVTSTNKSIQKFKSAITGAVAGVTDTVGAGALVLFFVVVLGSLFLILFLRRVL